MYWELHRCHLNPCESSRSSEKSEHIVKSATWHVIEGEFEWTPRNPSSTLAVSQANDVAFSIPGDLSFHIYKNGMGRVWSQAFSIPFCFIPSTCLLQSTLLSLPELLLDCTSELNSLIALYVLRESYLLVWNDKDLISLSGMLPTLGLSYWWSRRPLPFCEFLKHFGDIYLS